MKILAKQNITAAVDRGSTWYKITREDLLANILDKDNIWIKSRISEFPLFEALNLKSLEGSFATDDTLYLLVSDYRTIKINGEDVEPEEVPQYYELEDIQNYINENPTKDIIQKVMDSDISWSDINIDEFAKDLLEIEHLNVIAKDAEEIGLIEI